MGCREKGGLNEEILEKGQYFGLLEVEQEPGVVEV